MAKWTESVQKAFSLILARGHLVNVPVPGLEVKEELKKHGSQKADVFEDGIKSLVTHAKGLNVNAIATLLLSNWYHMHK